MKRNTVVDCEAVRELLIFSENCAASFVVMTLRSTSSEPRRAALLNVSSSERVTSRCAA